METLTDLETDKFKRIEIGKSSVNVSPIEGFSIPTFNYISLTYIASGNGVGEVETVTYKTGGGGGTTVAILTLAYNASNEISNITRT